MTAIMLVLMAARQLVTNHFLHFVALERADPKKFQVLQIIAALLGWSEGNNIPSPNGHLRKLTWSRTARTSGSCTSRRFQSESQSASITMAPHT